MSVTTDTSLEDDDVDDLWDAFERRRMRQRQMGSQTSQISQRTEGSVSVGVSVSDFETDDTDEWPYSSEDDFPLARTYRKSRVSAGVNGKPLVEFPVPRGVEAEILCNLGVGGNGGYGEVGLDELLLRSCTELRDGVRAGRDLLRAMRLEEVRDEIEEDGGDVGGTVRLVGRGGG